MHKTLAIAGTAVMGVSSFVACLASTNAMLVLGNVGLLASIVVMFYGFSKWQP